MWRVASPTTPSPATSAASDATSTVTELTMAGAELSGAYVVRRQPQPGQPTACWTLCSDCRRRRERLRSSQVHSEIEFGGLWTEMFAHLCDCRSCIRNDRA